MTDPATTKARLQAGLYLIPSHMHEGVLNYFVHRIPPGGFLRALLEDRPLSEIASRADNTNLHTLGNWTYFLFNYCPAAAWHSPEAVAHHLKQKEPNQ